MALPNNLHLGIAGWDQPGWVDSVFPRKTRPGHPLGRLAEFVNYLAVPAIPENKGNM